MVRRSAAYGVSGKQRRSGEVFMAYSHTHFVLFRIKRNAEHFAQFGRSRNQKRFSSITFHAYGTLPRKPLGANCKPSSLTSFCYGLDQALFNQALKRKDDSAIRYGTSLDFEFRYDLLSLAWDAAYIT